MDTDARVDVRMFGSDPQYAGQAGQINADAHGVRHPLLRHRVEHGWELRSQFRKIDVTMGVDEHARRQESHVKYGSKAAREARGRTSSARYLTSDTYMVWVGRFEASVSPR